MTHTKEEVLTIARMMENFPGSTKHQHAASMLRSYAAMLGDGPVGYISAAHENRVQGDYAYVTPIYPAPFDGSIAIYAEPKQEGEV